MMMDDGFGRRGDKGVLSEASGVGVGEKRESTWELGKDGKCKCGDKAASSDRYCTNCGRLLLRGGKPLPAGETPKRINTPTEFFVSEGAVEIHDSDGGVRGSKTRPDWEVVEGGEDPAVRIDADAMGATIVGKKKKLPPK